MEQLKTKISAADIILLLSVLLVGGFNEYIACLLSAAITIVLTLKLIKNKGLKLRMGLMSGAVALICLMYGISALYAVDSGTAIIGFFKFAPVLLYMLLLWQTEGENVLRLLPFFGAVTVVISLVGMHISPTEQFFSVAGRLAGFFQYPNTFALFLLVCELLLLQKERLKIHHFICLAVLIVGLLYTGSRTVFIFALLSNIILLIYKFKNRIKLKYLFIAVGIVAVAVALLFIFNPDLLGRYLSISLGESTFVGRLLYWMDSLPLLFKYPFGMGYLGYNFVQTGIQTGVYTVRYVHNDFLQLFLDVGWIPALLLVAALVKFFLNKNISFPKKTVVATICAHTFFDFNFQFLSILFVLLLLTKEEQGREVSVSKIAGTNAALILFFLANIWIGTHLALSYFGLNHTAELLYPFNTENKTALLEKETDLSAANEIADSILAQNSCSYIPYSVKAKYAYSQGDFTALIENKRKAIELNPFGYEEYTEYCYMLINGIYLYEGKGDEQSIEYCKKELISVRNRLAHTADLQSELGKKIVDQPTTTLPEELDKYIEKLEAENK